ncbi:MAG: DUF2807 domain-containing protein [Chloroflexi bacterium]|nr:DUF2807 domain-containing protein [Chloroflexota bacterium]
MKKKEHSIFWPLVLIAAGVIWLLNGMGIIPTANLWALTHLLPFILIGLGLGLILRSYWRFASILVSLFIVGGAVLAILFAPQLGWDDFFPRGWIIGSGNIGGGVAGSGVVKTETRKISGFESVSMEYPAEVIIRQGKTESVSLQGDEIVLPQILTEVKAGILSISASEENWNKLVNPGRAVQIVITVKDLNQVVFSSAGTLLVEGLKTDSLALVLSGAGEMTLSELAVDSLIVTLSGAGNVQADGVADNLLVHISGFGDFDGGDLHSQTAEVHVTGAGSATVWTDEKMDASVSGVGDVNYYGSPSVLKQISGVGSVDSLGAK